MMGLIRLTAFICILFGLFYLLRIDILTFIQDLSKPFEAKDKLKNRILLAQGRKKKNFFYLLVEDTKTILKLNHKEEEFPRVFLLSVAFAMAGLLIGFSLSNYFIVPVLCMGFCIIPFIYIKFLGIRLKKQQNEELETALSIITSSYIRCEDIVTAIEENVDYINPPIKEVFEQFVVEATLLNPDIKKLLSNIRSKIDNSVFYEWCDAVIACQNDGALKSTLPPIVKKCSNIRLVSVRLDTLLYAPVKEYITMVLLLVLNVPMMYFLNKTWFHILINHFAGKFVMALCACVIFLSAIAVIKIAKPIEYKR